MYVIHKLYLDIVDQQVITIPVTAEILSVDAQHGCVALWYKRRAEFVELGPRSIAIATTGNEFSFPVHARFLGTVLLAEGNFVGHVFELPTT